MTDEALNVETTEERRPRFSEMTKEELIETLRKIVEDSQATLHHEAQSIKNAYFALRSKETTEQLEQFVSEGGDPAQFVSVPDEGEETMRNLIAQFREMRAAWLDADQKIRQANLEEKQSILAQLRDIASDIDSVNVNFQKFQDLQGKFKEKAELPDPSVTPLWKEFQTVVELFYDQLKMNKELRDLDFRKNLEAKRQLVEQAKALEEVPDVVEAINRLMILHNEWRETGPVAKEFREPIWEEFKAASAVVRKRHQDYFEGKKANEAANEEAKSGLLKEIDDIITKFPDSYAAWDEATKKVIDLQNRWREIGFASRKANVALYSQFRNACDMFFKTKAEYFHKVKEGYSENLKKKVELCEKAEALINQKSSDAVESVFKLRDEWKSIGSAGKRNSDEVWQRFTTACNAVFERRKSESGERRKEETANLEAKKNLIEELKALPLDEDKRSLLPKVRLLQEKWNAIGHVPFKVKDEIHQQYRAICDKIYDSFDRNESRNAKGKDSNAKVSKESLQRQIEAKRNDLKTYKNNMGFFNIKSNAGNSMMHSLERKIALIEKDIVQLEQKLASLKD